MISDFSNMKVREHPLVVWSTIGSSDVVYAEFPEGVRVDLATAVEIVTSRLEFMEGKKHYLVTDMTNVREITPEAKEYMQGPEGGLKNILGAALIASNPVSSLIANIFVKVRKDFPAKFFTNKQDAFDWIYEHISKCR